MGTCGHDTSHQLGDRLVVHVEEHGANGWRDCVQCCGSHSQGTCRETSAAVPLCTGAGYLSEFSSANSSDKLNMPASRVATGSSSIEHVEEIFNDFNVKG